MQKRIFNRFKKKLQIKSKVFFGVLLAHIAPVWAAGGPPMISDDPGTPGDGRWEINLATLSYFDTTTTTYQLPLADFNYGVGDRLQLKIEMPWLLQYDASGANRSGYGNSLAGIKWRFYDAGENAWQVSTYPQIQSNFPLSGSSENAIAESTTGYLFPVEFVHAYDGYDINFEIGRWVRTAPSTDSWIAGFVFTREVRKGFEVMAELHEEASVQQPLDELILNFGARYDFSEKYTLLLSAGRDLHNTLANTNLLMTYLGLQMRY